MCRMQKWMNDMDMANNLKVAFFWENFVKYELTSSSKDNCSTFWSGDQYDRLTQQSFLDLLFYLVTV